MLYYALVFLVVGIVAGVLGLSGISVIATQISGSCSACKNFASV